MKIITCIQIISLIFCINALALPYSVTGSYSDYVDYADIKNDDHFREIMSDFKLWATTNAEKQCIGDISRVSDWETKRERSNGCGYCTLFIYTVKAEFLCIP